MKDQKGFATTEAILIVVIVALIAGVGYFVYSAQNKSTDTLNQANLSSQSTVPTVKKSDKDAVVAAVKASQTATGTATTYTVDSVVGSNAKGTVTGGKTVTVFVAHKDNGAWKVVYTGATKPGKDIGVQYKLPASWYTNN